MLIIIILSHRAIEQIFEESRPMVGLGFDQELTGISEET